MITTIRVDGGRGVGYGHLVRSSALASAVLAAGNDVTFITRTPAAVTQFAPKAASIEPLSTEMKPFGSIEAATVRDVATRLDADYLVLDSFEIDTTYQSTLRSAVGLCLLFDDDYAPINCDILVNGNTYADRVEYRVEGEDPIWCFGRDYIPLRRAFRRQPTFFDAASDSPPRVLVTMGGSDPTNASPVAVEALAELNVVVDVVVGPGFENIGEISDVAQTADCPVTLHENPDNLPAMMYLADIAVSATGTTVYELLASGTAVIGLPRIENQRRIATDLDRRETILAIDKPVQVDEITAAVRPLLASSPEIERMQRAGRCLVDGRGAERIATVLNQQSAAD